MALEGTGSSARDPLGREVKRKACDTCKRRKVRCSGENPCQHCQRTATICQYSLARGRLANAEKRIALLQERIRLVEAAWGKFVPNLELSVAIQAVKNQRATGLLQVIDDSEKQSRPLPNVTSNDIFSVASSGPHESQPVPTSQLELEQEQADALEWDESADLPAVSDGIGSLSVTARGIGYMGPQSGNALLRNLQSISILYFSPYDDLAQYESPKPKVPDHILKTPSFSSQCVDSYFKYYHCAYPILHEGYFRAQLMGALPKPKDGSWPVLLNIVLAIGAFASGLCNQYADIYFYREASRHLSWDILQRGSLSLVQAMALMANYLQKRNKPNSGFTLLGVAMNMAQGIGLHRELSGPTISTFTMEIRRRAWWTLFVFDSGARVTFGRPTQNLGGINIHLPRNLDDKNLEVDLDELPSSQDVPTVTSSLIWQIKLAKLGNLANERLLESQQPNPSIMLELERKVISWGESLPTYMQADYSNPDFEMFDVPRMVLIWRSIHLRTVIHRPFILDLVKQRKYLDFGNPHTPTSRCINAAEECILSILGFWNSTKSRHGALVWYACYWLVTAVFVLVICLIYDPQHASAMAWKQQIENSKVALQEMGEFEPTALRAARIIDNIMDLVPSSPDSTFFATNEPIRMELAELWSQSWADMAVPQEESPPQFSW